MEHVSARLWQLSVCQRVGTGLEDALAVVNSAASRTIFKFTRRL